MLWRTFYWTRKRFLRPIPRLPSTDSGKKKFKMESKCWLFCYYLRICLVFLWIITQGKYKLCATLCLTIYYKASLNQLLNTVLTAPRATQRWSVILLLSSARKSVVNVFYPVCSLYKLRYLGTMRSRAPQHNSILCDKGFVRKTDDRHDPIFKGSWSIDGNGPRGILSDETSLWLGLRFSRHLPKRLLM